jgi:flavin reductase (DIM6/NTAB) family NADH-FMN oxidoreductase RutF
MFFEVGQHKAMGLSFDPFKAIVAPRPIGWISTRSLSGAVNLAPYSFFNGFNSRPPIVGFSSEGMKDAATFAVESGAFICNVVTRELFDVMNASSAPLPRGESEFDYAGIELAEGRLVNAPRVKASPAQLECRTLQVISPDGLDGNPLGCHIVLGQVVGIHIEDRFIVDGKLDTAAMKIVARCGYDAYSVVESTFAVQRPPGG